MVPFKGKTHDQLQAERESKSEVKAIGKAIGVVAVAAIENRSLEMEY